VVISKKYDKRYGHMTPSQTILNDAFRFAEKYKNDPMAISASLMVVAKTIYLNMLGPEQTQLMIHLFADNVEHPPIEKVTIH
tara:strand:+ start:351 stop:596 length:246 start_codon:yes stop_codon:yes gene_type:complete